MKLSNHLTIRLSLSFILVILVWSVVYFFIQMKEIHDGIDEGLNNLKQEFVYKANRTPDFIEAMLEHNPLNIVVEQISYGEAKDFKEVYSDARVYFITEEEEEEVRMLTTSFYCEQDSNYYMLKFFTSTVERDDLVKNMLYLLIGLWMCLGLAIAVMIKKIINTSNKPFYTLLEDLKKFELDRAQMLSFPETNIYEYDRLNKSVQKLLSDNIETFTEQKIFIENASHELQTPLAAAKAKLDVLINDSTLSQTQIEGIYSALNSLDRMKRLNSSLLLLSKINNKQFISTEAIDIEQLLGEVLDSFDDIIEHKGIHVTMNKKAQIKAIEMNSDLAYILVNNLIKNAVYHNIRNGSIEITFDSDSITISNDGTPINDDVDIFSRYKFASGEIGISSGLGLSIVKSITGIYNVDISYHYNQKHIFRLVFP